MNQTEALSWGPDMASRNGERVARGIALLDEVKPDWWKILDGVNLNLWDDSDCVLGKLYGSYYETLEDLCFLGSESAQWSIDHGFDADTHIDRYEVEAAWLNAARTRRELAA